MSNANLYPIGEFSRLTGLSPDTLRFYELKGLLQPKHGPRNLRLYDDADLEHIALVKRMKSGDFSLDEILAYTTIRDQGLDTVPERLQLMHAKVAALHDKQAAITASIAYLEDKIAYLETQQRLR